jgi:hypothetical protein
VNQAITVVWSVPDEKSAITLTREIFDTMNKGLVSIVIVKGDNDE